MMFSTPVLFGRKEGFGAALIFLIIGGARDRALDGARFDMSSFKLEESFQRARCDGQLAVAQEGPQGAPDSMTTAGSRTQ
ncbi:hypothetical protein ABIB82_007742 [Bradyrhizobium sp. i1.8.4]